jgi:hypothetical protein
MFSDEHKINVTYCNIKHYVLACNAIFIRKICLLINWS